MKTMVLVTVACLGAMSTLRAQHTKAPAGSRIAGIAPPPAAPPAPHPGPVRQHHGRVSGPAFYGTVPIVVPVVVFPDGRVFADFGAGYERVVSVCGTSGTGFDPIIP